MKYAFVILALFGLLTASAADTDAQRRNKRGGGSNVFSEFHKKDEFAIGKAAPRLHLENHKGDERDLREFLGQWVFIEFGSYT